MDYKTVMADQLADNTVEVSVEDYVYKKVDGYDMTCRIYQPVGLGLERPTGAVLFYFGGGWTGGTMDQFKGQSAYLARQGLTCITVDYRVKSRHNVTPFECVEDCRDSVLWLIEQSESLGIDKYQLVMAGGSAGGHIVAAALQVNLTMMAKYVQGAILFNPVLDTTETGFAHERFLGRGHQVSPIHQLHRGLPPYIIFHGTEDTTVALEISQRYTAASKRLGNQCTLIPYEGASHGFFNIDRSTEFYKDTLLQSEKFLKTVGLLA